MFAFVEVNHKFKNTGKKYSRATLKKNKREDS